MPPTNVHHHATNQTKYTSSTMLPCYNWWYSQLSLVVVRPNLLPGKKHTSLSSTFSCGSSLVSDLGSSFWFLHSEALYTSLRLSGWDCLCLYWIIPILCSSAFGLAGAFSLPDSFCWSICVHAGRFFPHVCLGSCNLPAD